MGFYCKKNHRKKFDNNKNLFFDSQVIFLRLNGITKSAGLLTYNKKMPKKLGVTWIKTRAHIIPNLISLNIYGWRFFSKPKKDKEESNEYQILEITRNCITATRQKLFHGIVVALSTKKEKLITLLAKTLSDLLTERELDV